MQLRSKGKIINLSPDYKLSTGLLDKTGRLIYEGDRLQLGTGEFVTVRFNGLAFQLVYGDEPVTLYDDAYNGTFVQLSEAKIT